MLYYDEDSFNSTFKNSTKLFSAIHVNLQSSRKNTLAFSHNLHALKHSFQIIALSETGIRSETELHNIFPDYDIITNNSGLAKGGVALCIKCNMFSYKIREDLNSKDKDIETLWIELDINPRKSLLFTCIYRHPNSSVEKLNLYISEIFDNIKKNKTSLVMVGDINIDLIKVNSNKPTNDYADILLANNITFSSATIIDHVNVMLPICDMKNTTISTGNLLIAVSDHTPNFIFLSNLEKSKYKRPLICIKGLRNIEHFKAKLHNVSWDNVLESSDCNIAYNEFINTISNEYDNCFPLR